ncbi:MAG: hypothetical protein IJO53_02660, partial [Clostridia bacterium]|nr:hypothetical protein [Clostridia bacterium]
VSACFFPPPHDFEVAAKSEAAIFAFFVLQTSGFSWYHGPIIMNIAKEKKYEKDPRRRSGHDAERKIRIARRI